MSGGDTGTVWMPPQASTMAADVDGLFDGIYWVSVFFFFLITFVTIYFVMKYRRKSPDQLATSQIAHSTSIETIWTVIPTIIVLVIFAWGARVFMDLHVAPANATEINVTGQKWSWTFTYPNGDQTFGEMYAPKDRPVKLVMTSRDVIHSFFVPDFRIKQDVVPGRYTTAWFEATSEGDKQVLCTEYCGTQHSGMLAMVKVVSEEKWDQMMKEGFGDSDPVAMGEKIYAQCAACHSLDGSKGVGPSFKGLFGRKEKIQGAGEIQVDENYLRESILEPNAKIVEGFAPAMPSFKGVLSDKQIDAVIMYIKSLK